LGFTGADISVVICSMQLREDGAHACRRRSDRAEPRAWRPHCYCRREAPAISIRPGSSVRRFTASIRSCDPFWMRRLETVRLTREELYELVWSKPMTAIAADFGMSSVAFGKHCITMNVPTPGRGYWQRLQHGHKEKRSSLPKASPDTPVAIGI